MSYDNFSKLVAGGMILFFLFLFYMCAFLDKMSGWGVLGWMVAYLTVAGLALGTHSDRE